MLLIWSHHINGLFTGNSDYKYDAQSHLFFSKINLQMFFPKWFTQRHTKISDGTEIQIFLLWLWRPSTFHCCIESSWPQIRLQEVPSFFESSILSINRIKLLLLSCWYQVEHGLFQDRSRRIRNKCTGSFFIISYHDHKSALMLSRSLSLPV